MRILQRVLFIIAFVFLSVHSVRLIYDKWFEPRSSALDAYDEDVDVGIREATSLEELLERYDAAHRQLEDYEADETNPEVEYMERRTTEPYMSELRLREAIVDWESKKNLLSKTRLYWSFGLFFVVVGVASRRWWNAWVGVAALIVAFSEMIYWSSPAYFSGPSEAFERLLDTKLVLGLSSLLLLLVVARVTGTFERGRSGA